MKAFQLTVALWIAGAGRGVSEAVGCNEGIELFASELLAVVGDIAWVFLWVAFKGVLLQAAYIHLSHGLAQFPVHNVTTKAIKDAHQEVEPLAHLDVADVHVPLFMGLQWLFKAFAFAARLPSPGPEHT